MEEFSFARFFVKSIVACAIFGIVIGAALVAASQLLAVTPAQLPVKYTTALFLIVGGGAGWCSALIAIHVSTVASWVLLVPVAVGGVVGFAVLELWFQAALPRHSELPLMIGGACYLASAAVEIGSELQ